MSGDLPADTNRYQLKNIYGKRTGAKIGRPTRQEARAKLLATKPLSFDEFILHVSHEATKQGANSAIMSVYKELLKLKATMEKDSDYRITADEMARRNLQAERELKEAGYLEVEADE